MIDCWDAYTECTDCKARVWNAKTNYVLFDPVLGEHKALCQKCYQARQPKD